MYQTISPTKNLMLWNHNFS